MTAPGQPTDIETGDLLVMGHSVWQVVQAKPGSTDVLLFEANDPGPQAPQPPILTAQRALLMRLTVLGEAVHYRQVQRLPAAPSAAG